MGDLEVMVAREAELELIAPHLIASKYGWSYEFEGATKRSYMRGRQGEIIWEGRLGDDGLIHMMMEADRCIMMMDAS